MKQFITLLLLSLLSSACQTSTTKQTIEADARLVATLTCQAKALKDERFKVAKDIGIMEDSLLKSGKGLNFQQKAYIDSIEQNLTLRTSTLAKTITHKLDSLFALESYKTIAQRKAFDLALVEAEKKVCK
jgi:hypothetical protein